MKKLFQGGIIRLIRIAGCPALLLLNAAVLMAAATSPVKFDHLWVTVSQNAPEREVLERAGFHVSPIVNRHDGQGTSSITVEFFNSYLELIWADPNVPVAPGGEKALEKVRQRMNWRISGWCPFGIGLQRTAEDTEQSLPVPYWSIAPAWLKQGTSIDILTPKDDTTSPSFFVIPQYLAVSQSVNWKAAHRDAQKAKMFNHPNGLENITTLSFISPKNYQPIEAGKYLQNAGVFKLIRGDGGEDGWIAELTFDNGRKGKTKDLRPRLPLLIHY